MSKSFGQDESHRNPKKVYFSCAIGVYFMSFFYEHPVYLFIIFGRLEAKNAIFQNFLHLENVIFKLFGGPGGVPQWKKFAKNCSKVSVTPKIKKSLPFDPKQIALKMIYQRFSLRGVLNNPPSQVGLENKSRLE